MAIQNQDNGEPARPEYVKLGAIFVVVAALVMCAELLLLTYEPLLSFAVAVVVWILASSRLYPRKTAVRRALSNGAIVGVAIPVCLFIFRVIR